MFKSKLGFFRRVQHHKSLYEALAYHAHNVCQQHQPHQPSQGSAARHTSLRCCLSWSNNIQKIIIQISTGNNANDSFALRAILVKMITVSNILAFHLLFDRHLVMNYSCPLSVTLFPPHKLGQRLIDCVSLPRIASISFMVKKIETEVECR